VSKRFLYFKNVRLTGRVGLQFRGEFFNLWNWHIFSVTNGGNYSCSAFDTDVSSPTFGVWSGSLSVPRNIQLGMKMVVLSSGTVLSRW
jgi:hypothetical protein